ncbi:hypothetical protein LguiB_024297 [Lonicera macranthoides]
MQARLSGDELVLAAGLVWSLWKNRNSMVWERSSGYVTSIIATANSLISEWSNAQGNGSSRSGNAKQVGASRWEKLGNGMVKCNFDGALKNDSSGIGFVFVVRRENGEFISAVNGSVASDPSALMAEVISCKKALSLLK